jgi:hypothetical protein
MNFYIVAGIVFLLSIFGSKMINDRGLKLLDNDQKGLLVKVFAELYKYQLVFLAVIIGAYFLLAKLFPERGTLIMTGYLGLLFLFMFLHGYFIAKKLSQYGLPKSYSRYYVMSTFVKTGGMLFAMAILFLTVKK